MRVPVAFAALLAALGLSGSHARSDEFVVHTLVSERSDRVLVNAWGLAASPTGPWWTANEATETSTLYAGDGHKQTLTVRVEGGPTGVAFHAGRGFPVRGGGRVAPARFVYACEDGMLRAWTPTVPTGWSTRAEV